MLSPAKRSYSNFVLINLKYESKLVLSKGALPVYVENFAEPSNKMKTKF